MPWNLKRTKSKKVIDKAQPPLRNIIIKDKQTGFIDFKRQKGRLSFERIQDKSNPHASRFEPFNQFPLVYSKAKRASTSCFNKMLGRNHKVYEIGLTPSIYEPNTEYAKPSLAKTGITFSKMQPRSPIISQKAAIFLNNNSVIFDNIKKFEDKTSKFKSIPSPKFDNFKSRQSMDPRLPMFMDGITSRIGLNIISRKMLETNHFDETYTFMKFIPPSSRSIKTSAAKNMHRSQSQGNLTSHSNLLANKKENVPNGKM